MQCCISTSIAYDNAVEWQDPLQCIYACHFFSFTIIVRHIYCQHVLTPWKFFVSSYQNDFFTCLHGCKNKLDMCVCVFVCLCVCVCVNIPNWILEFSSTSPLPAGSNRYGVFENFVSIWTKQKWPAPNPHVNKKNKIKPLTKRLIMCCVSAYRLLKWGKQENWGFGKDLHWKEFL